MQAGQRLSHFSVAWNRITKHKTSSIRESISLASVPPFFVNRRRYATLNIICVWVNFSTTAKENKKAIFPAPLLRFSPSNDVRLHKQKQNGNSFLANLMLNVFYIFNYIHRVQKECLLQDTLKCILQLFVSSPSKNKQAYRMCF